MLEECLLSTRRRDVIAPSEVRGVKMSEFVQPFCNFARVGVQLGHRSNAGSNRVRSSGGYSTIIAVTVFIPPMTLVFLPSSWEYELTDFRL